MSNYREDYPALDKILLYMRCASRYNISKIVIGQSYYPNNMVAHLGAAFSQLDGTKPAPTARIIASHVDPNKGSTNYNDAIECITSSWKFLPLGYLFVNADYLPSSMGGGCGDATCLERVHQFIELILMVVTKRRKQGTIVVFSMGNPAKHVGDVLTDRLRASGYKIRGMNCVQPATLSRITCNKEMIGTHSMYNFGDRSVVSFFECMVSNWSKVKSITLSDIMGDKSRVIPDDTKSGLTNILTRIDEVQTGIVKSLPPGARVEDNVQYSTLQLMKDMTTLMVSDEYVYESILIGSNKQVSNSSKKSSSKGTIDRSEQVASSTIDKVLSSTPTRSGKKKKSKAYQSMNVHDLFTHDPGSTPLPQKKSRKKSTKKQEQDMTLESIFGTNSSPGTNSTPVRSGSSSRTKNKTPSSTSRKQRSTTKGSTSKKQAPVTPSMDTGTEAVPLNPKSNTKRVMQGFGYDANGNLVFPDDSDASDY